MQKSVLSLFIKFIYQEEVNELCRYESAKWRAQRALRAHVPTCSTFPTCPRALRALRALRVHVPYVPKYILQTEKFKNGKFLPVRF